MEEAFGGAAHNNEGHVFISLMSKFHCLGDVKGGSGHNCGRIAIMVMPSYKHTDYLCIRPNDEMIATLYAGSISNDDDDPKYAVKKGFLVFQDKNLQRYSTELEEFCILAEIEKSNKYIFTLFSRANDVIFTEVLPGLKGIDLSFEDNNVANSSIFT